jgi:glutathione S-transferase
MEFVAIVIALALLEYMYIALQVGMARGKYNVPAPATTGDPTFERYYRVQMNTVEQLVVFIPGMLLFSHFVMPMVAALLGLVFIAGRAVYLKSYVKDPGSRGTGFIMGYVANAVLVLGALGGAVYSLV